MSKHPALNLIIAYQRGHLASAENSDLERHLKGCEHCAQKAELLNMLTSTSNAPLRSTPARAGQPGPAASGACLSPEVISKFLCGELSFWESRRVEKHLATCEECREKLAEILRTSAPPMSQSERAFLSANSQLEVEQQVRELERLLPQSNKFSLRYQTLVQRIRRFFAALFSIKAGLESLGYPVYFRAGFIRKPFRRYQTTKLGIAFLACCCLRLNQHNK